jgi:predicted nucleic acid-binding protein
MRNGKVFVDANILIHAATFKSANVFSWIDSLYKEIYIHQEVLEELLISDVRKTVEGYIAQGQWNLFNPDDENALTDDEYAIYESFLNDMRQAFVDLDNKKIKENRPLKHTNDLGEIHSLAAALLLGASIICSNDYDIKEVIQDTPIYVTNDEALTNILIEQDTLVDFCYYTIKEGIEKSRVVRKFLSVVDSNKTTDLDRLLS